MEWALHMQRSLSARVAGKQELQRLGSPSDPLQLVHVAQRCPTTTSTSLQVSGAWHIFDLYFTKKFGKYCFPIHYFICTWPYQAG